MRPCLDSWAVLAWLQGEGPEADTVDDAVSEQAWMSWINVGEVACQVDRRHGAAEAAAVVSRLRGALTLDHVTPERVLAAARIKAQHPIAFADCFAVATAAARDAVLLTGDPELIERDLGCRVQDLRAQRP